MNAQATPEANPFIEAIRAASVSSALVFVRTHGACDLGAGTMGKWRAFLVSSISAVCVSVAGVAWADCTKDSECKGDRICVDGKCVDPKAVSSGASSNPPGPARTPTSAPTPVPSLPVATPPPEAAPTPMTPFAGTASVTATQAEPGPGNGEGEIYKQGTLGLSFGLPSGGAPTAGVAYFLTPKSALRADLGIGLQTDPDSQTDFSVEVAYRYYLPQRGTIVPFAQPGLFYSQIEATDSNTIGVTAAVGIEWFFEDRVSVSGATGLAFVTVNKPKLTKITTGTSALFVNFYW